MNNENQLRSNIKTGYQLPEKYFEAFSDRLFSEIKWQNKVDSSGYLVPKDYLKNFEVKIPKQPTKVVKWYKSKNIIKWSVAASLVVFVGWTFTQKPSQTITDEMIQNYIDTEEFNFYDLSLIFDETDLLETDLPSYHVSETELENYLMEESYLDNVIEEVYNNSTQ